MLVVDVDQQMGASHFPAFSQIFSVKKGKGWKSMQKEENKLFIWGNLQELGERG